MFHGVLQFAKDTREFLTPVLSESAFLEEGVLTPSEFEAAGDSLVANCPTWSWQTSSNSSRNKSYLPDSKQYLVTRGIACYRRISDLDMSTQVDAMVSVGETKSGSHDEWCVPSFKDVMLAQQSDEDGFDLIEKIRITSPNTGNNDGNDNAKSITSEESGIKDDLVGLTVNKHVLESDDEYEDMEDESLALDNTTTGNMALANGSSSTNITIASCRRYDCFLTYDKYYRTPRIWLYGYDNNGTPLRPAQIFEDIMNDYAKKTVTVESMPHLENLMCASVHPCQHASAMYNIINSLKECGKTPKPEQSLFVFLKFIQSVVPTIEYDFTTEVQMGKK
jgi:ubiquitin-like-conjugating enzyme ATG3